ncbi:MAG: hypothetical protein DMF63_12975 [Acidobacteria bacterium]|nr:MAG: hypothetical protein DMF63_12975 [Acidobacteriota bacterium]
MGKTIFFVVLSIFTVWAIPAAGQSDPATAVLLFNGRKGTGASQPIPVGVYQVSGKQLGSGEASVKVSKGYIATFCAAKNGTGKCEELGEGTHDLASIDFNYIKVARKTEGVLAAPVIVYELEHWAGRSQGFAPGMYRSIKGEFGNILDNHAMSVIVAKGFRVKLCTEEGPMLRGHGECEVYETGRHDLRFANDISFVEVKDMSDTSPDDEKLAVVLYEDASQVGKMQGFDVGMFFASRGEFKKLRNDQASSIWVKEGYRAEVCSDEPAAGGEPVGCEVFASGKKNLKARRTASYIKVSKVS